MIQPNELNIEITTKKSENFDQCYIASSVLSYPIKKVYSMFENTNNWIDIFDLLHIEFKNKEQKKISEKTEYIAKADDEDPATYTLDKIIEEQVIKGILSDQKKDQLNIFFKEMKYKFKFEPVKEGCKLIIEVRFSQKGNYYLNAVKNKLTGFDGILQQILKRAFKLIQRELEHPESFQKKREINQSIQPIPSSTLPKEYTHGNSGQCIVDANISRVATFLDDLNNYEHLHPRFEKKQNTIKFTLPISYVELKKSSENNTFSLKSKSGIAMISGLTLEFSLEKIDENKTLCKMRFLYDYRSLIKLFNAETGLDGKISNLAGTIISTCLRHLTELMEENLSLKDEKKVEADFGKMQI